MRNKVSEKSSQTYQDSLEECRQPLQTRENMEMNSTQSLQEEQSYADILILVLLTSRTVIH